MNTSPRLLIPLSLLLGLALAGPRPAAAQDDTTVRIVNHHQTQVRVFAFDNEDRRHEIGTVGSGDFEQLVIPSELVEKGAVQIKVYPSGQVPGLGAPSEPDYGVKSSKLTLNVGDTIDFWIEPELADSMVRLTRG